MHPLRHRRGMALLLVVISMAVVGGLVSALASYSVRVWEDGRAEQLRTTARIAADSAAEYVRLHRQSWRTSVPIEPVRLSADDILPPGVSGTIQVGFESRQMRRVSRVSVLLARGVLRAREETEIPLD